MEIPASGSNWSPSSAHLRRDTTLERTHRHIQLTMYRLFLLFSSRSVFPRKVRIWRQIETNQKKKIIRSILKEEKGLRLLRYESRVYDYWQESSAILSFFPSSSISVREERETYIHTYSQTDRLRLTGRPLIVIVNSF